MRSAISQWKHFRKSKTPNMTTNGASNSSRKIVNAKSDSVKKNHVRSYKRYGRIMDLMAVA